MKKILLSTLVLLFSLVLYAQNWTRELPKEKTKDQLTLSDYRKAFNDYWSPFSVKDGYYMENGEKKKASGWKQFKRWEYEMENKIDPATGKFPEKSALEVYKEFAEMNPPLKSSAMGNWTSLGPNSSGGGYAGVGRINCIAFHPSNNNVYWVGAASGGLWYTTNNGVSWTCLTSDLGALAVSDIIIPSDFATSNTIYIATGDRDAWDNRSIGVMKSTDGGATWNTTGISYTLSQGRMVNRLLLSPANNQTIIAATTVGVFKTTDGGATWNTQLSSNNFIDMEYKPGDFNTLYASTENGYIYVSSNGGLTWISAYNNASAYRIELAVSANQPTWVYAIAARSSSGLFGIFKSTNSGASYSQVYDGTLTNQNLLGWESNGSGTNGQGWYDLSLAVSPSDANTILLGGINTWRSTNGGTSWAIANHWWGDGVPAVHADKHNLVYRSNGDLFECNDGGVYLSTNNGTSWADKTNGMVISQMYKLGVSKTVPNEVIAGLQDNGTKLISGGLWNDVKGGDGMECLIDYTDVNIQYGTYTNGQISRTTNHWASSTAIEPSGAGDGAWVTPYIIDPVSPQTLYAGYADIWKTTNRGTSWTKISTMNSGQRIRSMAIAPSNTQVLYVADQTNIWKTTNGGTNWSNITGSLPVANGYITYIAVKNDDANTLWVTFSNFNSNRVFQSVNGGTTWTNISVGLPQIPAYTIVQNTQSSSGLQLFVGTELGVYVKNGSDDWVEFNSGLPKVKIGELEIYYDSVPQNSKLRAATYGRGLWESEIFFSSVINPSNFTATTMGETQIDLSWTKNIANNNVIIAVSQTGTFGAPVDGSSYSVANTIVGGGTVIYSGNASSFSHTNLNPSTTYYYKIWSCDESHVYSTGNTANATTLCKVIDSFPWSETFSSAIQPTCWSQVDHAGNGQIWQFGSFTETQAPNPALTGNYAFLNSDNYGSGFSQNADLISPVFDFTYYTDIVLGFKHFFQYYNPSTATLSYSINNGASWTQLQQWTTGSGTNPAIFSQNVTAQVAGYSQVLFKWNYTGTYAWYWAIDDISITAEGTVYPNLTVTNVSLGDGQYDCWNALQNVTVAGPTYSVVLLNGAEAYFIAGESINFKEGFHAQQGSLMHAYITETGEYCSSLAGPAVVNYPVEKSIPNSDQADTNKKKISSGKQVKIYPNPNSGKFFVELSNFEGISEVSVTNMSGSMVRKLSTSGDKVDIELPFLQKGIYFVSVKNGNNVTSDKFVVQ